MLGRSGLDLSGLGGKGEPEESHQESVTNRQTVCGFKYVCTEGRTYGKTYVRKAVRRERPTLWSCKNFEYVYY